MVYNMSLKVLSVVLEIPFFSNPNRILLTDYVNSIIVVQAIAVNESTRLTLMQKSLDKESSQSVYGILHPTKELFSCACFIIA